MSNFTELAIAENESEVAMVRLDVENRVFRAVKERKERRRKREIM